MCRIDVQRTQVPEMDLRALDTELLKSSSASFSFYLLQEHHCTKVLRNSYIEQGVLGQKQMTSVGNIFYFKKYLLVFKGKKNKNILKV